MRLVTLTSALVLLSASYALAGPGAGEPKQPADPSSGRPAAILDESKCASVWSMTQRDGDTLSEGHAAPFVVNFKMVDADSDGKITEAEFKEGCKKGLVQEASAEGSQQPAGKASPEGAMQPSGKAAPTTPQQ
jgi:hypothetical protein